MNNHTVGPWHFEQMNDFGTEVYAICNPETVCAETVICTVDKIADARLIAAAQDMHELIGQINRYASIIGDEKLFHSTNVILAKVKGE